MSACPTEAAPDWLARWRRDGLAPAAALARFDAAAPVAPEGILGRWRGATLPTGHPLDGALEALGWYGKEFRSADEVHPLLFADGGAPVALDPAFLPASLALRLPRLARSGVARAAFRAAWPLLRARGPGARLTRRRFRGQSSAAMIYHRQPVADHFRAAGEGRLLGCMERHGMAPFFFLLEREEGAPPAAAGRPSGKINPIKT